MPALSQMIHRVFEQAWVRYGKAVAYVVRPVEQWNLPVGFDLNRATDSVTDAAWNELSIYEMQQCWVYDEMKFVPATQGIDTRVMIAAGVIAAGSIEVGVLAVDLDKLRVGWAVQVGDFWYDVSDIGDTPIGAASVWAKVRLTRRS
jgi:hypothetical protein